MADHIVTRIEMGYRAPKQTRPPRKSYADGLSSGMFFFHKYGIDICNNFIKKLQPKNEFDRGVRDAIEKSLGG
jgi:hypothetical protein